MKPQSHDLFDESTMSFGDHLEALRIHLWKALIGLAICVVLALFIGHKIVAVVRAPIDSALKEYNLDKLPEEESPEQQKSIEDLIASLSAQENPTAENKALQKILQDYQHRINNIEDTMAEPVTLAVQEAFTTIYLKVSFVAGLVLASPWVIYQIWLFVAAGLYPHERKYVYIYLPISIFLFLGGALFCFYAVFPFVLNFLLGFNKLLGVNPQIRLSEWISFAITLPLMFGLSFQLPLIMLFLERISVFEVKDYIEKTRMAILVISIISMLMTPADPMSMLLMMLPLLLLYGLGIAMCKYFPSANASPFESPDTP
ncbi:MULTISPECIES: twin-arginine translocase subunit TatC [Gimesia]|uniref:Sec-independent protein translocase protein TatC n=2 Tax=Gimesia TaxID=1649453 RepID=A0A6I6AB29_9PLAN|nr:MULTISPECIES: twin-arginine translocase subunit TatC [Gimesia]MBN67793.1 twin-arginine translocase subunit TatC [Gimesia sp.]MCR9230589.1 twin-arginine translocase subunit TatC [bacterium]QDT18678.1 Sec-independent protein translocase protein TatCy [Gimesia chilikensis]QDT82801.1 Sec-independent protein translocase protein TatCy [Gimesia chilikensis]QGQ23368.1 twin-arginine translocase subunit TatC [Gimesia benthica]